MAVPAYFESIRQKASQRWEQLESDPELAGPWHQLFKQVQSPRHILSELLQNADDAGAFEAHVRIENGAFVFSHNGEDFSEDHFASLCRFGYSNKRALHTIGFRGIGFKSTFSLGQRVELYTPTLSIAFHQNRFTEPVWSQERKDGDLQTTVRVEISDEHRQLEVEKNLSEWVKSPVSLLFFKNIRSLTIGDHVIAWKSDGAGPVPNSHWMALAGSDSERFLLVRSEPESFPEEALAEIRQERMLGVEEEVEFPPCAVEIVLGAEGRLYVVLPTGVKTELPFACNAPFIQDPARMKIKDPETSPTNRWLLERSGRLAADAMLCWLGESAISSVDRAKAYDLMPDVDREESSLSGVSAAIVEIAFSEYLEGCSYLFNEDESLSSANDSIVVPSAIYGVWSLEDASKLIGEEEKPLLSSSISSANRAKLVNWGVVDSFSDAQILASLQLRSMPQPDSWRKLLKLWVYLAPHITGYSYMSGRDGLKIVPVQGREVLLSAREVVRLGEKKILPTDDDWAFFGDRLLILNQNWLRFLTEQRRLADDHDDSLLKSYVKAANEVLSGLSLHEPSDTSKVINRVASSFFSEETVTLSDSIRLAQLAAKLNASVGDAFRFVTQDRKIRTAGSGILVDSDGSLDLLLPEDWAEEHLLHPDYLSQFKSCTKEEWERWVDSGRAKLASFVQISSFQPRSMNQRDMEKELSKREFEGDFSPRYKSPWFSVKDWDFEEYLWIYWKKRAKDDEEFWAKLGDRLLSQPSQFWSNCLTAEVSEISSNGHSRRVIRQGLAPTWVTKLRQLPCLRDTRGVMRIPAELLRRTIETEALLELEPFVHASLDSETNQPLLELLGVGDTPTGPEKLLGRLRALAQVDKPPVFDVEKWYFRLDQIIGQCSTAEMQAVRDAFSEEKIILTASGSWDTASGVFLHSDEQDAPGAEIVRESVRDLSLWRRIGVAERPSVELAIKWLNGLPSGKPLSQEDLRRVRALLARHSALVWDECEHWLSLSGEWMPIEEFDYALTMQALVPWSHLHQWVKRKTADLQRISAEQSEALPFSALSPLAAHVEENIDSKIRVTTSPVRYEWLRELGSSLRRIELDEDEEAKRIRDLGDRLENTDWQTTEKLETISYVDKKPAGTPRRVDAIWLDNVLYVEDKPMAALARAVAQELGRSFRRNEIVDAIKMCFERSSEFVIEYMEANFELLDEVALVCPNGAEVDEKIEAPADHSTEKVAEPEAPGIPGHSERPIAPQEEGGSEFIDDDQGEFADTTTLNEPEPNTGKDSPPTKPKREKPSLIQRFARMHGFEQLDDKAFADGSGNQISRCSSSLFQWERTNSIGEITKRYWVKEHCLEREPLEIGAEIWSIAVSAPEKYSLILVSASQRPVEVSGQDLKFKIDSGVLTLHPSTYKLVCEDD